MKDLLQKYPPSRWLYGLASANMVFFLLPPLMMVLVAGTVAQRWIGLYSASKMFFSAVVIWLGGVVPVPGGWTLMAFLTVSLFLKFLLKSEWQWKKAGVLLAHLGALVLMCGGLLTALTARESYMVIPEGAESAYLYDYHKRELIVYEDARVRAQFPYADIAQWDATSLPFTLTVVGWCENCGILKRADTEDYTPDVPYRGMAQNMALQSRPPEREPEANLTGLTFALDGVSKTADGVYMAFEGMPKPVTFEKGGHTYQIVFGKAQRPLPFSVKLTAFEKQTYSGLEKARAYTSDLLVKDQGLEWPVRIEMNKPFRYRGYTFFQSSFEEGADFQATILAVVENRGRLFPYIGTGLMGLGLFWHLVLMVWNGRRAV